MIEKTVRMSLLFDFYGQLLTQRQQEFFKLYYDDDLSLGEIASQYGVSRQAVYDILKRSSQALEEFESKLQLVERFQRRQSALAQAMAEIDAAMEALSPMEAMGDVVQRLARARAALVEVEAAGVEA
ncbi:MAG TPA: putative DNA-binding protein [Limnochordia bacterium]|nr:putative DNA-binding protein [Limnochordia bacterium]